MYRKLQNKYSKKLIEFYKSILSLLNYEKRIVCIVCHHSTIHVFGFYKSKKELHIWLRNKFCYDYPVIEQSRDNVINDLISEHPELLQTRIIIIYPELKTIYRNKSNQSNTDKFISLLDDSEYQIEQNHNNTVIAITSIMGLKKISSLFKNNGLNVVGIYRGNPEWVYAHLVQKPEMFTGQHQFGFVEKQSLHKVMIGDGNCCAIDTMSIDDQQPRNIDNFSFMLDSSSEEIGDDSVNLLANGSVLCHFYPQFSSFNFLSAQETEECNNVQREKKVLKFFLLFTLLFILINLLLFVPNQLVKSRLEKVMQEKHFLQTRIDKIEKLTQDHEKIKSEYNRIASLQLRKTALGRALYTISDVIPNDVWLNEITYDITPQSRGSRKDYLLLAGISKKQNSIIEFVESLEKASDFQNISIENYEINSDKKNKYRSKQNGIHFLLSLGQE